MRIYIGNLSYETSEQDLRQMFEAHGEVQEASVVKDRDTGRSKGFGFVEMPTNDEAQAAITALNGTESLGRSITVNEARPRPERGFGGGGGGGGFGGQGGGGFRDKRSGGGFQNARKRGGSRGTTRY